MAGGDAAQKARAAQNARAKKTKDNKASYVLWIGLSLGSVLVAGLMLAVSPERGPFQTPVNDQSLIAVANRNARTWKAGASSFFDGWTMGDVKLLSGVGISEQSSGMPKCQTAEAPVPDRFDAREKWPKCFSSPIYNMGNCTASWAVATASSLSNRYCIASPEEHSDLMLSPQQLLSCDFGNRGCQGGTIDSSWQYIQREGLVSEVCFPYQADGTVSCGSKCATETPLKSAAACVAQGAAQIKAEVLAHGPVVAPLFLTDDFLVYRGGVYKELPTTVPITEARRQRIIQAVKIIGWGKADGLAYWIIENSWGEDWGEHGYARVPQGMDPEKKTGLVVEDYVVAGSPASQILGDAGDDDEIDDLDIDEDAEGGGGDFEA